MNDDAPREQAARRESVAPSPLFLGFLGALGVSAVMSFGSGLGEAAFLTFALMAWAIAGAVLVAVAAMLAWAARNTQRGHHLAMLRPGCDVAPAVATASLRRALRGLRTDVRVVPLGLTALVDDAGVELWAGSAEHPVRVCRAPWHEVVAIDAAPVRRWGRAGAGLAVTVRGRGGEVCVPVALLGGGLGGLLAPRQARADLLALAVRARRDAHAARV